MTIPSSSVPAAGAWLLAAITSTLNDPTVTIAAGEPGDDGNDSIYFGDVRRQVEVLAMVGSEGPNAFKETYEIDVMVSCWTGDDDPAALYARAASLADSVIAVVRTDPTLGGAVSGARPGNQIDQPYPTWTSDDGDSAEGYETTFRVPIYCYALL